MLPDIVSGTTVPVTRTLVVMQRCEALQQQRAGLSCSSTGCLDGGFTGPANGAPNLFVLPVASKQDGDVLVPSGWQYDACKGSRTGTRERPCETVASAKGKEDGDRTASIVTCPLDRFLAGLSSEHITNSCVVAVFTLSMSERYAEHVPDLSCWQAVMFVQASGGTTTFIHAP